MTLEGKKTHRWQENDDPVTIVLADEHNIIREGLRRLLDREPDLEVIGETDNLSQALPLTRDLRPDVDVLDFGVDGSETGALLEEIQKCSPQTRIVVLSLKMTRDKLEKATFDCSYLFKEECTFDDLAREIRLASDR